MLIHTAIKKNMKLEEDGIYVIGLSNPEVIPGDYIFINSIGSMSLNSKCTKEPELYDSSPCYEFTPEALTSSKWHVITL